VALLTAYTAYWLYHLNLSRRCPTRGGVHLCCGEVRSRIKGASRGGQR
jgi:hypothetical protein